MMVENGMKQQRQQQQQQKKHLQQSTMVHLTDERKKKRQTNRTIQIHIGFSQAMISSLKQVNRCHKN